MSAKPRLLDLFCGAGGATRGYQLAGFHVTGVDIAPQPHYCGDEFVRENALYFVDRLGKHYDAIHASPPCKAHTVARRVAQARFPSLFDAHEDLVGPTRERLRRLGLPYVIENVPGAPLENPLTLCGSMFGMRQLRRHRLFECSGFTVTQPDCRHGEQSDIVGVYGNGGAWTRTAPGGGGRKVVGAEAAAVLGIDWTEHQPSLSQAIPPAYTEHIGRQLLEFLRAVVL